ncbi:hypothetical protein BA190_07915 [Labrys sp. WJW]|nr:hypothetical protein BA190_07915 [Labrys sp. WJW]
MGERSGLSDEEWELIGPLFGMIADKAKALLADRGYDSNAICEEIVFHGVRAVIPAKRCRRNLAL